MTHCERRYELLYGDELGALMRERPLAWLPFGVLEHHGEHLPWGLDGLKAHAVCLDLAERLGGVVLPAQHLLGVHGDRRSDESDAAFRARHADIGDFMFREATLRRALNETFDGLVNIGFRVIIAYTGHYPTIQTRIVSEAAQAASAEVIPFWEPLACGDGDHGGKWETSIYMAVGGEARLDAVREDRTGEPGVYRGQRVRDESSVEFGQRALAQVELYLKREIDSAFARL